MDSVIIRNASKKDLEGIMDVELDWPEEQRAGSDKFVARLDKCPQGFFVAEVDGKIVGTSTSCVIRYDPFHPEVHKSWDIVTNDGYIHRYEEIENPNALYIVSIGIKRNYRAKGIFQGFAKAQVDLAIKVGLPYVLAGAIMPGYDSYCKKYGDITAEEYGFTRIGHRLADPFLEVWRGLDFHVPDNRHIMTDYYSDTRSRNYSALVVYEIKK
ncbi:MAG TPA: GNAT family N-acetyltransferase [Thermodesulfovibrionales bacterium]|nr:GNAT family N-acetyltransferase [Thermodesulfovibrionales bacterium]